MYQLKVRKEYSLTKELHLTIHLKLNFIQIFFPSIHMFYFDSNFFYFFFKNYISHSSEVQLKPENSVNYTLTKKDFSFFGEYIDLNKTS